jgi:hypothetical protein
LTGEGRLSSLIANDTAARVFVTFAAVLFCRKRVSLPQKSHIITKRKKMTITSTVLYLLFILAFIVHDGEEIAMEHNWLLAHAE